METNSLEMRKKIAIELCNQRNQPGRYGVSDVFIEDVHYRAGYDNTVLGFKSNIVYGDACYFGTINSRTGQKMRLGSITRDGEIKFFN